MYNKIVLLSTFSTIPRTVRMAQLLVNSGHTVHIIEWDRTGKKPRTEIKNGVFFRRLSLKAGFGMGIFYLIPIWLVFVVIHLMREKYDIVQPQNLDSLIPAFISIKLLRRGKILYDLADFYSDVYTLSIPIVRGLSAFMERFLIKRVDALILVSDRQILQIKRKNLPKKMIYFYNAPLQFLHPFFKSKKNNDILSIFYAGTLSYDRVKFMVNVFLSTKNLPIKFDIAGFGEQEHTIRRLSDRNSQISFLGRLCNKQILNLTAKADLVLLPYDPKYFNNKIGLPNKLFEAMYCETAVLASRGTYMGEIVENQNIGFVVDFTDRTKLRQIFELLIKNVGCLQKFQENARNLYSTKFRPQEMGFRYLRLVEKIGSK